MREGRLLLCPNKRNHWGERNRIIISRHTHIVFGTYFPADFSPYQLFVLLFVALVVEAGGMSGMMEYIIPT